MKRILTVVGISLLSAVVLPVMAEDRPISQVMKEIQGSVGAAKKAFEGGNKEGVASNAEKLEKLFKECEEFFVKRGGMPDAVEWSKNGAGFAKELNGEATSGTKTGAQAALGKVGGSCKGCHDAHREKLPEGGYKIK